MIDIMATANGWIVRPSYRVHSDNHGAQHEIFVFNDSEALAEHVESWADKELLAVKKPCDCGR